MLEIGLLLSRQFLNVLALTRLGGGRLARVVLHGARGVTSRSRLLARSIRMLRGPGRNRRLAEAPRLDRLPSLQVRLAFCLSTDLVKGDLGLPGRSGQRRRSRWDLSIGFGFSSAFYAVALDATLSSWGVWLALARNALMLETDPVLQFRIADFEAVLDGKFDDGGLVTRGAVDRDRIPLLR